MKQFGGNVFVGGVLFYWLARKDCANHADRIDRSHAPLLECTNATVGRWRVQDLWKDEVKHNWDRLFEIRGVLPRGAAHPFVNGHLRRR
jgi:hypothetical protein